MIEFESIEAENFCQFEHYKLRLRNRGLVWIRGINTDTKGSNSNGSGKSNCLSKALGWALFEKSLDGDSKRGVIRDGAKSAVVTVRFRDDNERYRLRRTRNASMKLELEREVNKKWVAESASKKALQERVEELLGMDWDVYRSKILFANADKAKFLSADDKTRKAILTRGLGLEKYEAAAKVASQKNSAMKRKSEELFRKCSSLEAKIEELKVSEASIRERSADWASGRAERVKRLAKTYASALRALAAEKLELVALSKRGGKLEKEAFTIAERAERECWEASRELQMKLSAAEKHLGRLDGKALCPTCDAPIDEAHLAELRGWVAKTQAELGKAEKSHVAAKKRREKAHAKYHEAKEASEAAADRLEQLDCELQDARKAHEGAKTELNPFEEELESIEARIESRAQQLEVERAAHKEHEELRAYYEFWTAGFGPSGLPSMRLDEAMGPLTEFTNKYLETLSDGDITVNFSTQKELKSDHRELRDKISVDWAIEGSSGHPPSDGQWRRMDLAAAIALSVVTGSGGVPLMILDEVLDGLDKEGRARVVELLRILRAERGSIFVISHDDGIHEVFERQVVVTKKGGVSTLSESEHD